jgi:hypothetical protein
MSVSFRATDLERSDIPGGCIMCKNHTEDRYRDVQLEDISPRGRIDVRSSILTTASTEVSTMSHGSKQNLVLVPPPLTMSGYAL